MGGGNAFSLILKKRQTEKVLEDARKRKYSFEQNVYFFRSSHLPTSIVKTKKTKKEATMLIDFCQTAGTIIFFVNVLFVKRTYLH